MVLPRPEPREWQFWWTAPSRRNLPYSEGWKISSSNLLTLPFVPALQLSHWSAPCVRACMKSAFSRKCCSCPHWAMLLYLQEMFIGIVCCCCCLIFPLVQGLKQKWEPWLKDWPKIKDSKSRRDSKSHHSMLLIVACLRGLSPFAGTSRKHNSREKSSVIFFFFFVIYSRY